MSQYRNSWYHNGHQFEEIYGHDHAIGYFADIYVGGYDYDGPTVQISEMFGETKSPAMYGKVEDGLMGDPMPEDLFNYTLGRVRLRYTRISTGADECEKMICSSHNHLGHSIAEQIAEFLGKPMPESTKQ